MGVELRRQLGEHPLSIALAALRVRLTVLPGGRVAPGVGADFPVVGFPLESDTASTRRHEAAVSKSWDNSWDKP